MLSLKSFVCFCIFLSCVMSSKMRLNLIESRLNTLELRIHIESHELLIAKESIEVLNNSVSDIQEMVCVQEDKTIDKLEKNQESMYHTKNGNSAIKPNANRALKAFKEQKAWSNAVFRKHENRIYQCETKNAAIGENMNIIIDRLKVIDQKRSKDSAQLESMKEDIQALMEKDNHLAEEFISVKKTIGALYLINENLTRDNENLLTTIKEQNKVIGDIRIEISKLKEIKLNMERQTDCPDGWQKFDNSCYFFHEVYISYTDASEFCARKRSHLVDIQNEKENSFVSNFSKRKRVWLGLTDEETEGQWIWERTGEIAKYINWRPGQPNNIGQIQHYGVMGGVSTKQWDDIKKKSKGFVMCKMLL